MRISIKLLSPDAVLPVKATSGSSGFDLVASEGRTIMPNKAVAVPTGLSFAIPPGYEGQVRPRSGLALNYSISVLNSPGTIDSDYRGEVRVILFNHDKTEGYYVAKGSRIAQLVVVELPSVEFEVMTELDDTVRGSGGFGSTGV